MYIEYLRLEKSKKKDKTKHVELSLTTEIPLLETESIEEKSQNLLR